MSLWLDFIFLIAAFFLVYYLYTKYLHSQRDIHELALTEQSNISLSRKSDETAIYRSSLVPHEMPLVTGLQIRQEFRLRDGNIRDVWSVVMHSNKSKFVFLKDDEVIKMNVFQVNSAVKELAAWIKEKGVTEVGSVLKNGSWEGFITGLTCFVNGFTLHSFDQVPRSQPKLDLIIVTKDQLPYIKRLSFQYIIVVGSSEDQEFESGINWSSIVDHTRTNAIYEYKYQSSYDQGTPLVNHIGVQSHSFTHQNFVSATSAIVKTIPLGHEFNEKDILLIHNFTNQVHYWSKVFALTLFGGTIIFNNSNASIIDVISDHKPTLLAIDPQAASAIHKYVQSNGNSFLQSLKLSRAQHLFSEGIFSKLAQLQVFESIRLIYLTTANSPSLDPPIPSSELTDLRALIGARIIIERTLPQLSGPLTATNFYDYRIFSNAKLANRGVASLALEIKLFKKDQLDIDKKKGELCIRGFIVGRPTDEKELEKAINEGERVGSEGWMPTSVVGSFGRDGCFYET